MFSVDRERLEDLWSCAREMREWSDELRELAAATQHESATLRRRLHVQGDVRSAQEMNLARVELDETVAGLHQ